jgi:hypothetical protein
VVVERLRHDAGEPLTIDRQRRAGGHPARLGGAHDERSQPPHFFLQQSDGVIELVTAEGIAAHQFGQPIGLVHAGLTPGAHLVEDDTHAS